jgi:hypothetical protein
VHFILIKPVFSDPLSCVTLFQCSLGGSPKTCLTVLELLLIMWYLIRKYIQHTINICLPTRSNVHNMQPIKYDEMWCVSDISSIEAPSTSYLWGIDGDRDVTGSCITGNDVTGSYITGSCITGNDVTGSREPEMKGRSFPAVFFPAVFSELL